MFVGWRGSEAGFVGNGLEISETMKHQVTLLSPANHTNFHRQIDSNRYPNQCHQRPAVLLLLLRKPITSASTSCQQSASLCSFNRWETHPTAFQGKFFFCFFESPEPSWKYNARLCGINTSYSIKTTRWTFHFISIELSLNIHCTFIEFSLNIPWFLLYVYTVVIMSSKLNMRWMVS